MSNLTGTFLSNSLVFVIRGIVHLKIYNNKDRENKTFKVILSFVQLAIMDIPASNKLSADPKRPFSSLSN